MRGERKNAHNVMHVRSVQVDPVEDRLLQRDVIITDDQMLYLKNHTHMSRSELAKKLGISKIDLLTLMREHGIANRVLSYEPEEIA